MTHHESPKCGASRLFSPRQTRVAALFLALVVPASIAAQTVPRARRSNRITDAQITQAERHLLSSDSLPIFMQAADQGSSAAKLDLGLVFLSGVNHADPNVELALQWFERASTDGNVRAASYIGDFYLDPRNGRPDTASALFWYEKAEHAQDARGTAALAGLSCNGTGIKLNLPLCGVLLDTAATFVKPTDPADVSLSFQRYDNLLGAAYHAGKGVPRNNTLAAGWYAKGAALGSISAALAESKLYIEPGGLPHNLPKAVTILDAITKKALNDIKPNFCEPATMEANSKVALAYAEIGAKYEARGPRFFPQALAIYNKAADRGDGAPIVALGLRYVNGSGVPRDFDKAQTILMELTQSYSIKHEDREADGAALHALSNAIAAENHPADASRIALLKQASMREMMSICPAAEMLAAAEAVATAPVERYPNLSAPDSVTTQQQFSVDVSLDTSSFDDKTKIASGVNDNGQLQFTLPTGMTSMPIQVDLIAPGMTFINGDTNSGTLTLDANSPDSTPATFHLQAGTSPATITIRANLSYHQQFIAQITRSIAVTATAAAVQPPIVTLPAPTPATGDTARGSSEPLQPRNLTLLPLPGTPNTTVPQAPIVGKSAPLPVAPTKRVSLGDTTAQSADLSITETLDGDTMHYSFDSPVLTGPVYADVAGVAATKAIVDAMYVQLQAEALTLSQVVGTMCATARAKGAGGPTDPSCSESRQAQSKLQSAGYQLFTQLAPQQFRDVYQLIITNHILLRSITVVTNSPLLPWELMLPVNGTDKFLGLTTSIVRENASAPQLAQPANVPFSNIAIVLPQYDADKQLPSTVAEAAAITKEFPQARQVEGDADSVTALAHAAPAGIIHYSGHGQSVPPPAGSPAGVAPQTGILLEDETMTPGMFTSDLAQGQAQGNQAHPFYFFNACDIGNTNTQLNYIEGWAPALMESGASGYLGALYTVGDERAESFAAHFYADLKTNLASNTSWSMADLVTQARQQTYAESNDPTALAYVLYTKPFMKLVLAGGN